MTLRYRFQPPWWASLLTLIGVLLFVKLSLWQWHRYHYKKNIQLSYAAETIAPAKPLLSVLAPLINNKNVFIHVSATGYYDTHQFLLDNRISDGRVGFEVITPLMLTDGQTILVNRGFVPANVNRQLMQSIEPPSGLVQLEGFLILPEKIFVLGNIITPPMSWPIKIMRIDSEYLSPPLHAKLLPQVILLSPQSSGGFVREWSPPNLWAERSLGYCFQWLAFAALAIILYLVMNLKKKYV